MVQRTLIANAGGQTFFEKLRNGFNAVQKEVEKVEQLTSGVYNGLAQSDADSSSVNGNCSPDTSYFQADIELLADIFPFHESTFALNTALTEEPVNLDSLERRLQKIRERLIKFEENPALLKKGYQPYIPENVENEVEGGETAAAAAAAASAVAVKSAGCKTPVSSSSENVLKKTAETGSARLFAFASPAEAVNGNTLQFCTPNGKKTQPNIQKLGSILNSKKNPPTLLTVTPVSNGAAVATTEVMSPKNVLSTKNIITVGQTVVLSSSTNSSTLPPSNGTTLTTTFQEPPVIVNAKLANCLNILNRWNTVTPSAAYASASSAYSTENSQSSETFSANTSESSDSADLASTKATVVLFAPPPTAADSISRNATFVMRQPSNQSQNEKSSSHLTTTFTPNRLKPQFSLVETTSLLKPQLSKDLLKSVSSTQQQQQQHSINRSKTFTMEAKPKQFAVATSKQPESKKTTGAPLVEYETVEFTPGMTSKVRKY